MGSDNLFKRRKNSRNIRKSGNLRLKSTYWLIVCEGEKTEPNYFKGVVDYYNRNVIKNSNLKVKIIGTGRNTVSLVNYVDFIQKQVDKRDVLYEKIFVVFDKDDFENFDSAIKMCVDNGYIPLWSNQAIEYWFLLHFNKIDMALDRALYEEKLNDCFKKRNVRYKYKKNDEKIFERLNEYGSLVLARRYAKDIHTEFKNILPSKACSCTTVYKFFDELDEKIKELE